MARARSNIYWWFGAAVLLAVFSSVFVLDLFWRRVPRTFRTTPPLVQPPSENTESTSESVESMTTREGMVIAREKSAATNADAVNAKALRIDTLTRLLSNVASPGKFMILMEGESYGNEVLPEHTKLNHSICSKNDTFVACESAVTWSHQSKLGDGCEHLFLDVGSNIGMHARFLFEPYLYRPRHLYDDILDNEFGVDRIYRRENMCVVAFEPNPTHRQRHQELAAAYARQGWRYHAFYAAVRGGSRDTGGVEKLVFYRNDNHANNDWGFSIGTMHSGNAHVETIEVATVDLSQFIMEHVAQTVTRPRRVLMKMDIEGSEYTVLPYMLANDAFRYVDVITAEFHHWSRGFDFIKNSVHISQAESVEFANMFPHLLKAVCSTTFQTVDDESFLFDGQKLPI